MVRLSHAVRRRRWIVIGVWIALVAFSAPFAFMPSLIALLGDRVWWLPGWLDRILPRIELD